MGTQEQARGLESWASANLNDTVRFKLTHKGYAYIEELNRTHPVYSMAPLKYQPDKDGWIETLLWDFANVFGPTMGMGFDQTVETGILLKSSAVAIKGALEGHRP